MDESAGKRLSAEKGRKGGRRRNKKKKPAATAGKFESDLARWTTFESQLIQTLLLVAGRRILMC